MKLLPRTGSFAFVFWELATLYFQYGYLHALRQHPLVNHLENYSIGSSSSNAFAFWKDRVDFSAFDFCIIEYCVNDTTLLDSGLQSAKNVSACLTEAILSIKQSGCTPLLLMLPLRQPRNDIVPELYRQVGGDADVQLLDGILSVKTLAAEQNCSEFEMFEDGFHLKREIAGKLACKLLDGAIRQKAKNTLGRPASCNGPEHIYLPASEAFGLEIPKNIRGTSLITSAIVDLSLGDGLDIYLSLRDLVVAIAVDLSNCRGVLSISRQNSVRISLTTFNFKGDHSGLVLTVWPLPVPIRPLNGCIRLNDLSDTSFDVGLHHQLAAEALLKPIMIGLCGVITRRPNVKYVVSTTLTLPPAPP